MTVAVLVSRSAPTPVALRNSRREERSQRRGERVYHQARTVTVTFGRIGSTPDGDFGVVISWETFFDGRARPSM